MTRTVWAFRCWGCCVIDLDAVLDIGRLRRMDRNDARRRLFIIVDVSCVCMYGWNVVFSLSLVVSTWCIISYVLVLWLVCVVFHRIASANFVRRLSVVSSPLIFLFRSHRPDRSHPPKTK